MGDALVISTFLALGKRAEKVGLYIDTNNGCQLVVRSVKGNDVARYFESLSDAAMYIEGYEAAVNVRA